MTLATGVTVKVDFAKFHTNQYVPVLWIIHSTDFLSFVDPFSRSSIILVFFSCLPYSESFLIQDHLQIAPLSVCYINLTYDDVRSVRPFVTFIFRALTFVSFQVRDLHLRIVVLGQLTSNTLGTHHWPAISLQLQLFGIIPCSFFPGDSLYAMRCYFSYCEPLLYRSHFHC
jgi:hypothetical protein